MAEKDFDDILTNLGTSKWNYINYFILGITGIMMPSLMLSGAFSTPNIPHKCIPHISEDIITISKNCTITDFQNETMECISWDYHSVDFPKSMTEEFDLVCTKAYLRPIYQSAYMFGNLVGVAVNGLLADRFGRKRMYIIGNIILVSFGIISTILTNIHLIITFRFIMGLCHASARTTGFISCLEICEKKHRSTVGALLGLPWALGTMWYGILGYLIKDWRWLQRTCLIPGILVILLARFISESPRWLIVNGKFEEALKTLNHAAKLNGVTLPSEDDIIKRMERIQKSSLSEARKKLDSSNKMEMIKEVLNNIAALFRTPAIRKLILTMYALYFSASLVFYGLSLNAVNFKLNPYIYMIIGGIAEVPAYTAIIPIISKFGRVRPTAMFYSTGGIAILILTVIPSDIKWLFTTLVMLGKLFITAAFIMIYLIGTEAYPTEVRMQSIGTSQLVSRIGPIAASFLIESVEASHMWILSAIFGITSLSAGFITLLLPETLNAHLPETIEMLERNASLKKKKCMKNKNKVSEDNVSQIERA